MSDSAAESFPSSPAQPLLSTRSITRPLTRTRAVLIIAMFLSPELLHHRHRHLSHSSGLLAMGLAEWSMLALLWLLSRTPVAPAGRPVELALLPTDSRAARHFVIGCAAGVVLLTSVVLLLAATGCYHLALPSSSPADSLIWGAAMGVVFLGVGALEEIVFRGVALRRLIPPFGAAGAVLLSSLIFAVVHIDNPGENMIGIMQVFVAGLLFAVIALRTRTLWMGIGLHATWDWSQNFLYSTPDSGIVLPHGFFRTAISGPAWLSGGSVGPEGSVLTTLVLLIATCFFWKAPGLER